MTLEPSKYNWIPSLEFAALQVAQEPEDLDILACTGRDHEPWTGRLSATPSYIQGRDTCQELWSVTLNNKYFGKSI